MDAAGLESPYSNDWSFEGEAAYIYYKGKQVILPSYSPSLSFQHSAPKHTYLFLYPALQNIILHR